MGFIETFAQSAFNICPICKELILINLETLLNITAFNGLWMWLVSPEHFTKSWIIYDAYTILIQLNTKAYLQ